MRGDPDLLIGRRQLERVPVGIDEHIAENGVRRFRRHGATDLRQRSLQQILRRGDVHLDPPANFYCPYTSRRSIASSLGIPVCSSMRGSCLRDRAVIDASSVDGLTEVASDYYNSQLEQKFYRRRQPMSVTTPFEPARYLTRISGSDYLEVKWRLVWMRDQHPDATIETQLVSHSDNTAVFRAMVSIPGGGSATGWGSESAGDFRDYLEKAETKAIGRALAALGIWHAVLPGLRVRRRRGSGRRCSGQGGRASNVPLRAPTVRSRLPSRPLGRISRRRSGSFAICRPWPARLASTARRWTSGQCRSSVFRPRR